MTVTITGVAAVEGDVAAYRFRSTGRLEAAEAVEKFAEELPSGGVDITLGHGGERLGEVIYGEIDQLGRLALVGVLADDTITSIRSAIYFSPEMIVLGPGIRTRSRFIADIGGLVGVALTVDPAGLALPPVQSRRGDVRNPADRGGWPVGWPGDTPLLARAVDRLGSRRRVERLVREPVLERTATGVLLADDELIPTRRSPLWLRHDRAPLAAS